MKEEWKSVVGFEGYYEVSNRGRVRGLLCHGGYLKRRRRPKVLKRRVQKGCNTVKLSRDSKAHFRFVHRLVAQAFIPNPENKPFVNHKNFVRDDNNIDNLEWCTGSENIRHAMKGGRKPPQRGEDGPKAKLSNEEIRSIFLSKGSLKELALIYNVHVSTISAIRTGKNCSFITKGCQSL